MATFTLGPTRGWAVGETISAYEVDARGVPTGSAVETAAVASDSYTAFEDLDADTRYIATDGTTAVFFSTLTDPSTGGVSLPAGGTTGQVLAKASDTDGDAEWVTGGDVPADADGSTKGLIQLAGDLTGTAASPQIATGAVGANELASNSVETAKIQAGAVTAAKVAADVATQAELDAHAADSTSVHGITDTSTLVLTDDSRMSNTRTPSDTSVTEAKLASGLKALLKAVAVDGGSGYPARPSGYGSVEWIGPDDPAGSAQDGDTWTPTEAP